MVDNDVLVAFVAELIGQRVYKHQIKLELEIHLEMSVSVHSFEVLMTKARTMLRDRTGKAKEEHLDDAYEFYTSIIRDKSVPIQQRIRAQERLDNILALEPQFRNDKSPETVDDKAARMRAVIAAMEADGDESDLPADTYEQGKSDLNNTQSSGPDHPSPEDESVVKKTFAEELAEEGVSDEELTKLNTPDTSKVEQGVEQ